MENRDLAEPLTVYLSHLNALHEVAAGFCHPSVDQAGSRETGQGDQKRLGDFILLD